MPEAARMVVIWNPSSGSADRAAVARKVLEAMPQVTILEPGGREASIDHTTQAANEGANIIVAAGGDGTVSSVVEGLMRADQRSVLGVLPLGTGNDLARSLQIPLSPLEAVETLSSGYVGMMDVVEFTSSGSTQTCANMLTGGNTGRYLQQMTDEMKERWGPFCYLRGVIDVLRDLQVYRIDVTIDDGPPETFEALNVFLGNGRFSGGGLAVSPEAKLDDGKVDVVIVRDGQPGEIAGLASQYALTDFMQHDLIAFRQAQRLTITSHRAMPLTADGDEVGETPLSVVVQPQGLRVVVPNET